MNGAPASRGGGGGGGGGREREREREGGGDHYDCTASLSTGLCGQICTCHHMHVWAGLIDMTNTKAETYFWSWNTSWHPENAGKALHAQ